MKTYNEFIVAIEAYYEGSYSQLEAQILQRYLSVKVKPGEFNALFDQVTSKHSKKWKSLPDKAIFEELLTRQSPEARAEVIWNELRKYENSNSILVTDPVAQAVILSMGGWDDFVLRRMDNAVWSRKEFIEIYCNLDGSVDGTPQVLLSWRDVMNKKIDDRLLRIVGDQDAGTRMLAEARQNTPQIEMQMPGEAGALVQKFAGRLNGHDHLS